MKPHSFEYFSPDTLDEALELKSKYGDEGKILAGGQSLIPAMNFRVSQPEVLIDLNKIAELKSIRVDKGNLSIGSMTTQSMVEKSREIQVSNPLIHETMPNIAHSQIRNRGTFGGSMAHADPAAELPTTALALEAKFKISNHSGSRWVEAAHFFQTMFTTSLEPTEILVEINFPEFSNNYGWSFLEIARRKGDYALAGVATLLELNSEGICQKAKLVFLNVGDKAISASTAEKSLIGEEITDKLIKQASEYASQEDIFPMGNVHATPAFQRHLSKIVAQRSLKIALDRVNNSQK